MSNDTTHLFGLPGVEVVAVEIGADDLPMLELVTACEQARCCPGCGVRAERPHSWVRTRPRDLPVAGRRTALRWTKRRWRCGNQHCARKTFTEALPSIPPRHRLTARSRAAIGAAVADAGRTVVQAARDFEVSWPVANAAFVAAAKAALPVQTPAVERLGIDETRRGRAKFRLVTAPDGAEVWEIVADRWHVGFCDLTGGAGLLGQVEGRNAASVSEWIEQQSATWRAGVRVVAIDMCTVFKAAVTASLPHATLVVDRFHVVQLANAGVTEVRRRVTVQTRGRRGRKGNREWELRNRLTRSAARMHASQLDPMVEDLQALPKRIGEPILAAWNCKEDLMDLLALHGTNPDRTRISALLTRFYASAAASGLPEMERLANTVSTWWPQILVAITTGVTNAASGGINRLIKTDARCAFGYRNPPPNGSAPSAPPPAEPADTSPPTPADAMPNHAQAQNLDLAVLQLGKTAPAARQDSCAATATPEDCGRMIDSPEPDCWLHPDLEVRASPIQGHGLFARAPIPAGTAVSRVGGRIVTWQELQKLFAAAADDPARPYIDTITVTDSLHLVLPSRRPNGYGNHSCDPNLWWTDAYTLTARRDIATDEEATSDYGTSSGTDDFRMACTCQSPLCRSVITGNDWRLPQLQERYREHWIPVLAERIRSHR